MYIVHKLNVHNYFIEAGLSVESFMANKSILLKMTFTLVIVSSETCYSCLWFHLKANFIPCAMYSA